MDDLHKKFEAMKIQLEASRTNERARKTKLYAAEKTYSEYKAEAVATAEKVVEKVKALRSERNEVEAVRDELWERISKIKEESSKLNKEFEVERSEKTLD